MQKEFASRLFWSNWKSYYSYKTGRNAAEKDGEITSFRGWSSINYLKINSVMIDWVRSAGKYSYLTSFEGQNWWSY